MDKPRADEELVASNPWVPEQNRSRLAVLGKLLEELNEAGAIVARCIIQGVDEAEPVTHVVNRYALTNEIADVFATASIAIEHFGLSTAAINGRVTKKVDYLKRWHALIAVL